MLRKIVASIRAALQFVTKVIMVPTQLAGKLVLLPVQVLQRVAGSFGLGGGSEAAEEATSAAHAGHEAAATRAAARSTEAAVQRQAKASDVRYLARARAERREIAPALWERVPAPVADYLRALTPAECAELARRPLGDVSAFLGGEAAAIPGVRRLGEVRAAPPPVAAEAGTRRPKAKAGADPAAVDAFKASLAGVLGKPQTGVAAAVATVGMRT